MANSMKTKAGETALGLRAETSDTDSDAAGIASADTSTIRLANQFITSKIKLIAAGAVVVVLGAAAVMYYLSSSKESATQASLELSRAMGYYEAGDWAKALEGDPSKQVRGESVVGLKTIFNEYGRSEAGKTAAFYAGTALVQQQKYDEAQEYFEHASSSNALVVETGSKAGLALCKEKSGDYSSAAALYYDAANLGKSAGLEERYKFYSALNYEKSNMKDKAISIYSDLSMQNSASEFAGEAKNSLARLGTIIE
ncbi:hypothetical protein MASR2M18_05420 [Ignavibacteria bacterium]